MTEVPITLTHVPGPMPELRVHPSSIAVPAGEIELVVTQKPGSPLTWNANGRWCDLVSTTIRLKVNVSPGTQTVKFGSNVTRASCALLIAGMTSEPAAPKPSRLFVNNWPGDVPLPVGCRRVMVDGNFYYPDGDKAPVGFDQSRWTFNETAFRAYIRWIAQNADRWVLDIEGWPKYDGANADALKPALDCIRRMMTLAREEAPTLQRALYGYLPDHNFPAANRLAGGDRDQNVPQWLTHNAYLAEQLDGYIDFLAPDFVFEDDYPTEPCFRATLADASKITLPCLPVLKNRTPQQRRPVNENEMRAALAQLDAEGADGVILWGDTTGLLELATAVFGGAV